MRVSRGFSLLELILTLAVGTVVLAAAGRMLLTVRRFWSAERQALEMRHALQTAGMVLAAELRSASPASGDLLATSDTAVTLRAPRGLLSVCRPVVPGSRELVARLGPVVSPASPEPGRDAVAVLLPDGDTATRWLRAPLVAGGGATCPDGVAAHRLTLDSSVPAAALDPVLPGAPVRLYETLMYRLYNDGSGRWWLGVRSWQGGGWATTSPIAGPLRPRTGLTLEFLGGNGTPAVVDSQVRGVRIVLRAVGSVPVAAAGRRSGPREDSLILFVAPRNE